MKRIAATMNNEEISRYERNLGFIAPIYSAITHSDNLREGMSQDCLAVWSCSWTFDTLRQLEYFKAIATQRGYVCKRLEDSEFGVRLETRLE